MNRAETAKLMAVFAGVYRDFDKGRDPEQLLTIWASVLADIPYAAGNAAALAYIRTEHFPPVPADICKLALRMMGDQEMTEQEAWTLVSKAVKRTDWLAPEKEFSKLPEDIQRLLGSPSTLVEWGKADESTLGTVIASNFQRSYRARMAADRDVKALPQNVRAALEGLKLASLPGGENG
jgi:hypothetical protein